MVEPSVTMSSRTADAVAPPKSRGGPLPAGNGQGTANLEREPMVGDVPEKRGGGARASKKSLLAVPVGIKNKAAIDKLVSKFPAEEFAVIRKKNMSMPSLDIEVLLEETLLRVDIKPNLEVFD
uniref:Uncharacterized protein n=1 Tax=Oryza brachyantha TaxID=4533 RepID=J3KVQ6_ORYBR